MSSSVDLNFVIIMFLMSEDTAWKQTNEYYTEFVSQINTKISIQTTVAYFMLRK